MFFDSINEYHNRRHDAFSRLAAEPCMQIAKAGDRVLVSAGICGLGFHWERHEGIVLEVADTAYRVEFLDCKNSKGERYVLWVHRVGVTDVLGPKAVAN